MKARGERRTSNDEHRTSKFREPCPGGSAFDIRCSMFDVRRFLLLVFSSVLLFALSAHSAITFDATPSGGTSAATTLELVQDTAAGAPTGQYIGLRFNSSTPLTNVYARATVGGVGYSLDATETGTHFIGNLSTTAKTSYWFINNPTTGNGTFQVQIYVGNPASGGVLQATSASYTLRSLDSDQAASANKINSVAINGGNPIVLGQNFDAVVVYTVNSTINILVQPAGTAAFDPGVLRLGNTVVQLYGSSDGTGVPLATLTNQLYFLSTGSGVNSVRATFTFQAVGSSSTSLSPLVSARSGQYKYNADFSVPPVNVTIPAAVNRVSLAKSVSATTLNAGATVTYTITASNSGSAATTLDDLADTLPAGVTYAGNVKLNGVASTLAPVVSGSTLTFSDPGGTLVVPAGGTLRLAFDATIPNTSGTYTNSVIGRIGTGVIGRTETLGSPPATAATVLALADVSVTKTGPASIGAGVTFSYTINYVNNGPDAAVNVIVRDALPGAVTFVSASNGGTHSGGVVTWPAIASLANAAGGSYTVTVRAPASGSVLNSASSTADSGDPTPANNDGSAAAARVTTTITAQADVAATVSGPASVLPGATFNYTVAVTNNGPSPATNVVLSDALPATVIFVSASNGGTLSGSVVTWPAIASLANGGSVTYTITVTAPSSGTLLDVASSTSATADATPANNDGSAAASRVTTTVTSGVNVSGTVYNDANHNIQKDAAESGTGLVLYAKIIAAAQPAGPALQAVAVDPVTGAFTIPNVPAGSYTIVLNGDNVLANVTPAIPAGWSGTEFPSQTRSVAVTAIAVTNQNFGLIHALILSGRVFADTGAGGGTANDGVLNGGEGGLAGVIVKLTDATGATIYDTATSDGGGNYALLVPNTLASGTLLKVTETNPAAHLSTGASAGSSGGSYDRASDTVTFNLALNTAVTGVNFGDVPGITFAPDNAQAGLPGSAILYSHAFRAGSAGQVTFALARTSTPSVSGWSSALYLDASGNGAIDPGETQIIAPIALTAGQTIQILVKEFIPANAPFNAQDRLKVTANFSYTNASPALASSASRIDLTTVGNPTTAGLTLMKTVDKATARPGEVIAYTITFTNNASEGLGNVVISDGTPAFTTFASASNGPLPAGLTGVTVAAPGAGATGAIRWTFTGTLPPGGTGTLTLRVTLDQ